MDSIFTCDNNISIEDRFLFAYLCNCSHHKPHGLFKIPPAYISEDVNIDIGQIDSSLFRLNEDLIYYCYGSKHVFIPRLLANNILTMPVEYFADLATTYNNISKKFCYLNVLSTYISKYIEVLPYWFTSFTGFNKNQSLSIKGEDRAYCPHKKIIDIYHEALPELPQVKEWNQTCKHNLQRLWKEDVNRQHLDWWYKFFNDYIRTSDFLMGNVSDFQANLGWMVKKNNFAKIMNGTYRNRSNCQSSQSRQNRKVVDKVKEDTLSFEQFFQNDTKEQSHQEDIGAIN